MTPRVTQGRGVEVDSYCCICLQMNWTFQVTPHVTQGIGIEVDNDCYTCLQTFGNHEQAHSNMKVGYKQPVVRCLDVNATYPFHCKGDCDGGFL